MPTARIAAGFNRNFYGVVNSSGYMIGSTAAGATAGAQAGSPMGRLEGARTIPVSIPEGDVVPVSGDDEPEVSFSFESENLPNGVLEVSVTDLTFEALVQGTKVETVGTIDIGVRGPSAAAPIDMALLLQRKAKKWASGSRGVKAWEILSIPLCTIEALGSDINQRAFNPNRYKITIQKADRFSWGATFTEGLHGTTGGALVPIQSDNPLIIHPFQGNAARQLFTLAVAPVSSATVYVYVNGVKQTLTTDYTVSGADITFTGTPASGAWIEVVSEVLEANLP